MLQHYWPVFLITIPALALTIHYLHQRSKITAPHIRGGILFLFIFGLITSVYGVYSGIRQELTMAMEQGVSQQMVTMYGQDARFNALLLISAGIGMIIIGLIALHPSAETSSPTEE